MFGPPGFTGWGVLLDVRGQVSGVRGLGGGAQLQGSGLNLARAVRLINVARVS